MNTADLQTRKSIVVIGATGHFGGRISRRLVGEPNTELIVTSRRLESAEKLANELSSSDPNYRITAARLDQNSTEFPDQLASLKPFLVIHTAGPYQGQDYTVARASIRCGSHYVDLADGRGFVEGFDELHTEALNSNLLLVTGASTLPGLSSAVLNHMEGDFKEIREVEISIAPAHQTPRGPGTIAAVLSYCGKQFPVLENGTWVKRYGWQDFRIQSYPRIGKRLSGACDVPDLGLFPTHYQSLETVTFHAALEAWWEQITLWLMAWVTRIGIIKNWTRFVPGFGRISQWLIRLGSKSGGMHVRIRGNSPKDNEIEETWFLFAENNHGPEIPCSPALIMTRKLVRGDIKRRGALPCMKLFTLKDFDEEVKDLDISWELES